MPDKFTPAHIRAIQESTGLNTTNFAAALGVSRVSVWRWREGVSSPGTELEREQLERFESAMLRSSQSQEDE
jgi:DNA-binding transcriptional regulator YiaG